MSYHIHRNNLTASTGAVSSSEALKNPIYGGICHWRVLHSSRMRAVKDIVGRKEEQKKG
jgi:hypothetical protein